MEDPIGALIRAGQHDAARAALEALPEKGPRDWFRLGNLRDAAGDRPAARAAWQRAVSLDPGRAEAWYNLGDLARREEDPAQAADDFRRAIRARPAYRRAWIAWLELEDRYPTADRERLQEAAVAAGILSSRWQRPAELLPGLRAEPWPDPAAIPGLDLWSQVDWSTFSLPPFRAWNSPVTAEGRWEKAFLRYRGRWSPDTPPALRQILTRVAAVEALTDGSVAWSRLAPGTWLRPHCGPTNGRWRVHLGHSGLAGARLRVGPRWRRWSEEPVLLFDDSFEHEVRHEGTAPRVVLVIDLMHPDRQR